MKKLIVNLAVVVALYFCGQIALTFALAQRYVDHFGSCHEELNVAEKLRTALTDGAVDAVLRDYAACVKQRGNFLDRYFGRDRIDESIAAIKSMNHRSG